MRWKFEVRLRRVASYKLASYKFILNFKFGLWFVW